MHTTPDPNPQPPAMPEMSLSTQPLLEWFLPNNCKRLHVRGVLCCCSEVPQRYWRRGRDAELVFQWNASSDEGPDLC